MSDTTAPVPERSTRDASHHPRHRRDDVPVDGVREPDITEFGENPDTELAS
ncbi:hypothetical protein [Antiquaquibacter soli]|uniref:Uncharacterized protein n=1 Tax=Antiquaquibacter soli TaxID=3064523 RepID=A0ABT9BN76_9MICO|nr:hypothetical protein [Protaetiibacter sp. WY-16]MDO7881888.1 hypothetical protein [Protaetiibacter sp. WY-16]